MDQQLGPLVSLRSRALLNSFLLGVEHLRCFRAARALDCPPTLSWDNVLVALPRHESYLLYLLYRT